MDCFEGVCTALASFPPSDSTAANVHVCACVVAEGMAGFLQCFTLLSVFNLIIECCRIACL